MKKFTKLSALILALVMSSAMLFACSDETPEDNNPSDGVNDPSENEPSENDPSENDPSDGNASSAEVGTEVGDLAAPFALEIIGGDGKINVKDLRGKVVVINFWGTWCNPCTSELPEFSRLADDYAEDVVILAVHSVKSNSTAADYVAANYADSKIIFAYDQPFDIYVDMYYDMIGGDGYYPYTAVLDRNGVMTYKKSGGLTYEQLKAKVDAALAK